MIENKEKLAAKLMVEARRLTKMQSRSYGLDNDEIETLITNSVLILLDKIENSEVINNDTDYLPYLFTTIKYHILSAYSERTYKKNLPVTSSIEIVTEYDGDELEFVQPEEVKLDEDKQYQVSVALSQMSELDNKIYQALILGYTYDVIGKNLGCSPAYICHLTDRISEKIKEIKEPEKPKELTDLRKELMEMRNAGLTLKEISAKTGFSKNKIMYNTDENYRKKENLNRTLSRKGKKRI
jgi:DNA-directed RNA polymerase specialized sigma24 family protein